MSPPQRFWGQFTELSWERFLAEPCQKPRSVEKEELEVKWCARVVDSSLGPLIHLVKYPCFCDLQEGSRMGAAVTSPLLREPKPSTAVRAVPPASSAPAARSSLPLACATACPMSCPLAEAGCWRTFAITGTLIYSCGRLPGTSWSSPRISMDPGGIKNLAL